MSYVTYKNKLLKEDSHAESQGVLPILFLLKKQYKVFFNNKKSEAAWSHDCKTRWNNFNSMHGCGWWKSWNFNPWKCKDEMQFFHTKWICNWNERKNGILFWYWTNCTNLDQKLCRDKVLWGKIRKHTLSKNQKHDEVVITKPCFWNIYNQRERRWNKWF